MTLLDHIRELRRRLLRTVLALFAGFLVAFYFRKVIFSWLLRPAPVGFKPISTELTGIFGPEIKVAIIAGLILAMPYVLFEFFMFVSPGLTAREKRPLYVLLPWIALSFAAGVTFGYFILMPPAMHFLISYDTDIATQFVTLGNYTNTVITLLFWIGVCFETPLIMFALAWIGVLKSSAVAKRRRLLIVVAFVLGAIITPTLDPVNQTLVAGPLIVLFEIGIWLAKFAEWRRSKRKKG